MDNTDIYNYLVNKYKDLKLLDQNGNPFESNSGFDFNIYPDTGYIPSCSICSSEYNTWFDSMTYDNNNNNINMKHMLCGCIWFDYYKKKILAINMKITFEKKKS